MNLQDVKWSEAACATVKDKDLFFPDHGSGYRNKVLEAKALCGSCPIQLQCLQYGMQEDAGIWGGLTTEERKRLPKKRVFIATK